MQEEELTMEIPTRRRKRANAFHVDDELEDPVDVRIL